MPRVTIINSKLTIQMPKYSAPLPVKCNCSGARAEEDCNVDSLPGSLSMNSSPFEVLDAENMLPRHWQADLKDFGDAFNRCARRIGRDLRPVSLAAFTAAATVLTITPGLDTALVPTELASRVRPRFLCGLVVAVGMRRDLMLAADQRRDN